MTSDLTQGSVRSTVLRFSLPFLLSYFLQTLYGMADLYIIGQFCGVESTTAVSVGSQVMHMLTLMIVGLAMGSVVVIARSVGAGRRDGAALAIGNTLTLFSGIALALTAGLSLLVQPITRLMSTPEAAAAGTAVYLRICFLGIPFIVAYNVISSVFRGMGDSKSPMYFVAAACAANIALDYLFIGYLGLGPAGAALGTTLSQAFSVLIAALVISRKPGRIPLTRRDLTPHRQVMRHILKIGLPVTLQDGFIQISFILVTIFANLRGLEDAAAVGIVEKIIGILFLVPSSMLQTVSALGARNVGAGRHDRARQVLSFGCLITLVWGLLAALVMDFRPEPFLALFTGNARTLELGCQYMESYVWDCLFAGIHFCFSGYFCAYGLSALSFLHNALSIVLVRVPLSYLAARYFPATLFPMGLASPAGSVLSALFCLGAYAYLRRRGRFDTP